MASTMYTKLIHISVEFKPDSCWVLSSKDLPGLVLAGSDIAALRNDLPEAIRLLYKLNYQMDVKVAEAGDESATLPTAKKRSAKKVSKLTSARGGFIALPRTYVALRAS